MINKSWKFKAVMLLYDFREPSWNVAHPDAIIYQSSMKLCHNEQSTPMIEKSVKHRYMAVQ